MIRFRSRATLALAGFLAVSAASPASAFVAFKCTAKNSAGAHFSNEYFGLLSFDAKLSAASFALEACRAASAKPATCAITVCKKTHA